MAQLNLGMGLQAGPQPSRPGRKRGRATLRDVMGEPLYRALVARLAPMVGGSYVRMWIPMDRIAKDLARVSQPCPGCGIGRVYGRALARKRSRTVSAAELRERLAAQGGKAGR